MLDNSTDASALGVTQDKYEGVPRRFVILLLFGLASFLSAGAWNSLAPIYLCVRATDNVRATGFVFNVMPCPAVVCRGSCWALSETLLQHFCSIAEERYQVGMEGVNAVALSTFITFIPGEASNVH